MSGERIVSGSEERGFSPHESRLELEECLDHVFCGDACRVLARLPEQSVQCIVTSPPYFGHRVYTQHENPQEIGRETAVTDYIERLIRCLSQARQVLRDDGTLWLNLGDTYRKGVLQGVPWRVALRLCGLGWVLRSDIIWQKPNAMPASVTTRPTPDHEYLFLFSKGGEYYYDADAIREPHVTFSENSKMRGGRRHFGLRDGTPEQGKNAGNMNLHHARWDQAFHPKGRNKRTVWPVPLGKCREAHFAVFPEKLIEPCILAGCPRKGVVLDPFLGSGTTGMVAKRLGRHFVGIELEPEYVELARRRIGSVQPELPW